MVARGSMLMIRVATVHTEAGSTYALDLWATKKLRLSQRDRYLRSWMELSAKLSFIISG